MEDAAKTFLPLFPLELVVFPEQDLKLHIFEPRYRELLGECRTRGITFGIPPYAEQRLAEFGTEVALVKVLRDYPDGRMDVLTRGRRVFRLHRYIPEVAERLYSGGEVSFLENREDPAPETQAELGRLYRRLHELAGAKLSEDLAGPGLSFRLGQDIGLSLADKVRLLAMERESERQAVLVDYLRRVVSELESASEVLRKGRRNGPLPRPES